MATQLDSNFLYISPKVGDKDKSLAKAKDKGMGGGMLVDFIRPPEYGRLNTMDKRINGE